MNILQYTTREVFLSDRLFEELDELYYEMFGEHPERSCESCVGDALNRIKYTNIKKDKTMTEEKKECKFKFKEGTCLWVGKHHKHYTNDNLTDETAIQLIRISRGTLQYFEVIPDDLDEMLGESGSFVVKKSAAVAQSTTNDTAAPVEKTAIPTVEDLMKSSKHAELVRMAQEYPSPISFSETGTKKEIATAIIKRMILDAEV